MLTSTNSPTTLRGADRLIDLQKPIVMGILNLTPDSFFARSRIAEVSQLLKQVEVMLEVGAQILDLGAMSSRPGAAIISPEVEQKRLIEGVQQIVKAFPRAAISVDTIWAKTAQVAVEAGAHIINDISGGDHDPMMYKMVADLGVPYIMMHMQGKPNTMQDNPQYNDVVIESIDSLRMKIEQANAAGIDDIVIDPGFGFGKTISHNYQILNRLNEYQMLGYPVLAGLSRKSMLYKPLETSPEAALNATTAAHMIALQNGATILRVHDVKEAIEAIKIYNLCQENL